MSLTLALDQIQRPSWFGLLDKGKKYGGDFKPIPETTERRAKIESHLKTHTGRITTDDLMALTGATRSQVTKTLGDMFNEGLVEKGAVKIGSNKHSTWRLVEPHNA